MLIKKKTKKNHNESQIIKDQSLLSQISQNTKQDFKPKYYSNKLYPTTEGNPLTDIDSNKESFKTSSKVNYGVSNKVCISGDSKNFTNSISFKNFQGSEKTSSSRCKMSLYQIQKFKNENDNMNINGNEMNEFMTQKPKLKIKEPIVIGTTDKCNRRIGFTKKELSSLLQMKFLKKKNKTLK